MLKMRIISLGFKSISFSAGNIAIIRASRVASTELIQTQFNINLKQTVAHPSDPSHLGYQTVCSMDY